MQKCWGKARNDHKSKLVNLIYTYILHIETVKAFFFVQILD